MKAGAAVPVKSSLGGDQGLAIFAAGYPGAGRAAGWLVVPTHEAD